MVSATEGSPTNTGWKRRSSAASFSMCLRYSSTVVAPMACSSPRARAGLSMLPASMAPSAAPAPTMVCISSMKRMIWPSEAVTSLSTALSRSSNSPRNLAPATMEPRSSARSRLPFSPSGHVAVDDAAGQPLGDGGLAHARVAHQHRVVLGAAGEDLDDAADLLVAADHRVELPLRASWVRSLVYFSRARYWLSASGLVHPGAAAHVLEGGPDPVGAGARRRAAPRRRRSCPRRRPAAGARWRRTRPSAAGPRPRPGRGAS